MVLRCGGLLTIVMLAYVNHFILQHFASSQELFSSNSRDDQDISLWIDEAQVKQFFNGIPMKISAIVNGTVLPYVLDPNFEKYLPVIPSEVTSVNFTWMSGESRSYRYDFYELQSYNESILAAPIISIKPQGIVPKNSTIFQVYLPCNGNSSGVASFTIGFQIISLENSRPLPGTPIKLRLQKQCAFDRHSPDPECDKKCGNGKCNQNKICVCPAGFLGKYCESALCYPQCMNGGTCIAPGKCVCSHGFQGLHCEGGICNRKCLNGGKCVQKDKCSCRRGYYGLRCEYSKCTIPCLNGGRCIGVNRCRCKKGFAGLQCQIESSTIKCHNKCIKNQRKKSRRKFV